MGYALFSQASRWIQNAYGETDDVRLTEAVNAIRRIFYSWYSELEVVPTIEECFALQQFSVDCNKCADFYLGITLPRSFGTPEAMWHNNAPVQLLDRWRQWHTGITPPCECGLKSEVVGNDFPTECDLSVPAYLAVHATNLSDAGKTIIIRAKTLGGNPFEDVLTIGAKPVKTRLPVTSIDRAGGIVKDETKGAVIIAIDGGSPISIYAPDERVPAYTRLKITGIRHHEKHVNVRANRRYFPLVDPYDSVETDNQMVWESMARFLRLNRKTTRTGDEMASEASYAAQAKALLLGDKSREIGKATRTQVTVQSPRFMSHSRLVGQRRRF